MEQANSPLISPENVIRKIAEADVVVVDARGGPDATERYAKGHVQGAIMFNLETDLSNIGTDAASGGRHPLPDPKAFGALLGKAGITPFSHILVYDDKAGANAAARFWWMMRAVGHQKIQVVDGGLAAMEKAGVPMYVGPAPVPKKVQAYHVTGWQLPLADIDDVERLRADFGSLVIDVREKYRYRGDSEPIDLIAGHIPGAINVPYIDNLEATGRFRSPHALAQIYQAAVGDKQGADVVVHCGSGVTACHTALAMEVAGLPTPRLYVGSWSEWSRNEKPVARGDAP